MQPLLPVTRLKRFKMLLKTNQFTIQDADHEQILKIAESINPFDSKSIAGFGSNLNIQSKSNNSQLLEMVKNNDLSSIGKELTVIVSATQQDKTGQFIKSIPIIGTKLSHYYSSRNNLISRFESTQTQVQRLVENISIKYEELTKLVDVLENMYQDCIDEYKYLSIYIIAGEINLAEQQKQMKVLAALEQTPELKAQIADLVYLEGRLSKRITDFKIRQLVSTQTQEAIRILQGTNHLLIDKYEDIMVSTIPLWEQQLMLTVTTTQHKEAVETAKIINEGTNNMMKQFADNIRINAVETFKANTQTVVAPETIEYVSKQMQLVHQELAKSHKDAKIKQDQVEKQLLAVRDQESKIMIDVINDQN